MVIGYSRSSRPAAHVTIAVDTSVLMAIFKAEPTSGAWFGLLLRLRAGARLVACDVVWSEVAP